MDYDVKKIHIELTDKCNARCPLCPRTDQNNISKTTPLVKNVEITFDHFKKVINDLNVNHYQFCGNLGDPLSAKDFLKILEYIAKEDVLIEISTNGSIKTPGYFKRIGEILSVNPKNLLIFDLDGLEDTHSYYRRNTNFNKILENAKAFISNTKALSKWQFLIFDHNKHQVEAAKKLAGEIGFTYFRSRYSGWFDKSGETVFYDNNKKYIIKKAESPETLKVLDNIKCKSFHRKEIFLSASGHLFPCCHTGIRYHDVNSDIRNIVDLCGIDTIDTKKYSVSEIMQSLVWSEIENRWPSKKPLVCTTVCGMKNNRSVNYDLVL